MKQICSYYVRDKKFNQLFPQYDLRKIGYTSNYEQRIRQFPNVADLELVEYCKWNTTKEAWNCEQDWVKLQSIHFRPFYWAKGLNFKAIKYMNEDMITYLKSMLRRELTSNWGSTEWFVVKL